MSAQLHRQGVTPRRQGLDPEGVAQAVRLYQDGWSVARIGDQLGVDTTTAWAALKPKESPSATPTGAKR